jgi:15-cis-phytoene synthase
MTTHSLETPVTRAYRACELITREQARNFSYGIRLLPARKREMLSAVYAFARRIDDIGDGDLPTGKKLARLDRAEREIRAIACGGPVPAGDPVLLALTDATTRGLPMSIFTELVDGCRDDVLGRRYETFDDLRDYCRKVAGSIGRLSLAVFGGGESAVAVGRADALGVALQLTNILRDILEDRRAGRIYLPQEDLDRFGCTLDLDARGLITDPEDRIADLVRFEATRADLWYAEGLRLLPMLDHRSRACCAAMAGIYANLLRRIHTEPARVLRERTSLPAATKMVVAARALTGGTP